jgi:hypothetical protein
MTDGLSWLMYCSCIQDVPTSIKGTRNIQDPVCIMTTDHLKTGLEPTSEMDTKLRGFGPLAKYAERPPLVGEVVPTFADKGCRVVSATDPPGR